MIILIKGIFNCYFDIFLTYWNKRSTEINRSAKATQLGRLFNPLDKRMARDQNVITPIKAIGIPAMSQFLPVFLSHKESIIKVRAAKS